MKTTITTLQALCACEITYHIHKYLPSGEVKVSESELIKVLGDKKSAFLKESLFKGNYESRCFLDDAASCWIGKNSENELLIAFRGTVPFSFDLSTKRSRNRGLEALKDGMRNLFIQFKGDDKISEIYGENSQVHEGFHQETENMWTFLLSVIQEFDPHGKLPLTITGHSQGGAIAFLSALRLCNETKNSQEPYLQNIGQRIQQVITFGAPQAGDKGFAQNYRKVYSFGKPGKTSEICLDDITYRYEKAGDCIPFVPCNAKDLAALIRHRYSYLPISMFFMESWVERMNGLMQQYVPVGQLKYITYREQETDCDRSYELRLADLYLAWAEKGKKGDLFSIHFLFKDDGYIQQYLKEEFLKTPK